MANALYDLARDSFLKGGLAWTTTTTFHLILLNITGAGTTYTPNLATDQFLNVIPSGAVIADVVLTGVTASNGNGVARAANATFPTVSATAPQCEAVAIYQAVGTTSTVSPLIAYIDTATGLPVTPNGGDITVVWDTGTNGIFKL